MTNEIVYTNIELDEILTSATIEKGMGLAEPSKATSISPKQVQSQRSIDYKNITDILDNLSNNKNYLKSFDDRRKKALIFRIKRLFLDSRTKSPETFIIIGEQQKATSRTTLDITPIINQYKLNPTQKEDFKNFIIDFIKIVNAQTNIKIKILNKQDLLKETTNVKKIKDISPTHIDLLKSNVLNESFLRMFGTAIEMIVGRMFGQDVQLPYLTISGSPQQMQALTDTLSKEKRYVDSYVKYGLDDPRTYQDQYKLQNAINNFERETGIKWPIK